jgi:hypothetical protein
LDFLGHERCEHPATPVPNSWRILGVGVFNGGGNAALLWRDNNGYLSIWFMNVLWRALDFLRTS